MMNEVSTLNPTATPTTTPATDYQPDHLFVANLKSISLEKLVRSKLEVLFEEQKETATSLDGLYSLVIEQVEKPLIEHLCS